MKQYSEEIQQSLINILTQIENEDLDVRQRMLRECKQLELYWHGFQYIFWDQQAQDFRIPTHDILEQVSSREETKYIYDYVVNIFKAHGLSIIAALSAEVPGVSFTPMDADSPADTEAAQQAESLGKVIQKSNKAKLLFYHALFTLFTNHFTASYTYYERDEKHGTVDLPKFKKEKVKSPDSFNCTGEDCDFRSEEELTLCPECSAPLKKQDGIESEELVEDGMESINKGMQKILVKGTLNVKIPSYAADQDACGYLIDYSDQHYAWLRTEYPDIPYDKLSAQGGTDNYERMTRMPSIGQLYSDTYLQSLLTLKRVWLRPWMFNSLDKDKAAELLAEFPQGCYFAVVGNDTFAEARPEQLDAHWTISKGDLSRAVHGDPLGKPLLPLQDLENIVTNLLVESLEHSVPSTFADPAILDFDTYSKQEVVPGAVYPIKDSINSTKRLDDYFYTLKTSTLPKEGVDFDAIVEAKGQFVVGAFPSIFGGPQKGGKTLGEYQESRSYALQRLSIPYQLLYFWWSDTMYKSVKDYIKNMVADEKHATKTSVGRYENINLLVDDFTNGRFGLLLPESAVDLPVSFSQKRSTIEQIIALNSDRMNEFLFSPENRKVTLRFLGLEELSDLDSNQTAKQLSEIEQLLREEPVEELDGQFSSVPTEPELDDDEIHLRIIKTFACSKLGREHKKNNPAGYLNILLHGKEHKTNLEMQMQQQALLENPQPQPQEMGA